MDFHKMQIHEGFEILYYHGSLYVPVELIKLVAEFAM